MDTSMDSLLNQALIDFYSNGGTIPRFCSHDPRVLRRIKSGAASDQETKDFFRAVLELSDLEEFEALVKPGGGHEILKGWQGFSPAVLDEIWHCYGNLAGAAATELSDPLGGQPSVRRLGILAGIFKTTRCVISLGDKTILELVLGAVEDGTAEEWAAVSICQLLQAHGCDLGEPLAFGTSTNANLLHLACRYGVVEVAEFAIDSLGCGVDSVCLGRLPSGPCRRLPLAIAIEMEHYELAAMLISKGAKAALLGVQWSSNPLLWMIGAQAQNPRVARLLRMALDKQKDVLDPKYWLVPCSRGNFCHPLVHHCIYKGNVDTLRWFVESGQEKLEEAIFARSKFIKGEIDMCAFEMAASRGLWDLLGFFLEHTTALPLGIGTSAAEYCRASRTDVTPCPRAVKLQMVAALERAVAARPKPAAAAAVSVEAPTTATAAAVATPVSIVRPQDLGAVTNAPQVPAAKVLTEREEKKKAKKRAAKKKAKAKKRAAAKEASASAGKEEDTDSSNDSGDDTGEEGMDEEEKMLARAPAIDVEKDRLKRAAAVAEAGGSAAVQSNDIDDGISKAFGC
jgi:Ankyrin repeats (3 copies)